MQYDPELFSGNSKIIVIGPQRSGTGILAKMLAYDLGYEYISEDEIGINDPKMVHKVIQERDNFVIHAPAMFCLAHLLHGVRVAVTIRDTKDIQKSQERIQWNAERQERQNWDSVWDKDFENGLILSESKYKTWNNTIKPMMRSPYFEVEYESFRIHELWIDKTERTEFDYHQTKRN